MKPTAQEQATIDHLVLLISSPVTSDIRKAAVARLDRMGLDGVSLAVAADKQYNAEVTQRRIDWINR